MRLGSLYLQVALYTPDREGNEVNVDEGADVKLPEPESDDSNVDAVDKSGAVSDGRPSSLDGNAAVVAAGSTIEEPAAVRPMLELSGLTAESGKYVLVSIGDPEPSTTWTTETVWTTSVMRFDSRSAASR
jgi:hypothetical protein